MEIQCGLTLSPHVYSAGLKYRKWGDMDSKCTMLMSLLLCPFPWENHRVIWRDHEAFKMSLVRVTEREKNN